MNFAQCINPEWVQSGAHRRPPAAKPPPQAEDEPEQAREPTPSSRRRPGELTALVAATVAQMGEAALADIADALPQVSRQNVCVTLEAMTRRGKVVRTGVRRSYRYSLP